MHPDRLNVVLASDDNYALWMGMVIFSSLAKSRFKEKICFYVIDGGITEYKKNLIESMVAKYRSSVCWVLPDAAYFQGLPIKRYGLATYYRLALGKLLPDHVEKVIYLDCDLLVADDLKDLWDHDLKGHILGAVENLGISSPSLSFDRKDYFNAGVLLIDMFQWRERKMDDKLIEVMKNAGDEYHYLDQDALNTVFKNSWSRIGLRWNMQPSIWAKLEKSRCNITGYHQGEYMSALERPGVIHFLAKSKPWQYTVFHPYKGTYKDLFKTVFPECAFYKKVTARERVKVLSNVGKAVKNQRRIRISKKLVFN